MRRLFPLVLTLLVGTSVVSAEATLETLMPELRRLPPPSWVKPGARIIWWGGSNATLVVRRRLKKMAGAGFTELTVAAVDGNKVGVVVREYLSMSGSESEAPTIAAMSGAMLQGAGGDFWVHPQALKALMKRPPVRGIRVGRVQKNVNGKPMNTVLISMEGRFWQFDESSGVLVARMVRSTNREIQRDNVKTGNTMEFRAFEQVDYPWMKASMPAWTLKVKEYAYSGTQTVSYPGAPPVKQQFAVKHTRIGAGAGWFMTKIAVQMTTQQTSPAPEVRAISGLGSLGLCLPPQALARLKAGDVLAKNKWAQSTLRVQFVGENQGRNVAVLREEALQFENEWHYDLKSGVLIMSRFRTNPLHSETRFVLQGTK